MPENNRVKNVAIVGAAGQLGTFITDELFKAGRFNVTAITRKDSGNAAPAGVKVALVDYDNESTLISALQGQEVLVITMAVSAPKDTQSKLVRAAAAANVPFILPNAWGPDVSDESLGTDIFLGPAQKAVRDEIEKIGKSSWISVISSFWYDYSLSCGEIFYGMDWKERKWTFIDDGETQINTITWPQTGRAVASLLALPIESPSAPSLSDYKNKFLYVSSFTVSQKDMFDSVLRVTGTKLKDWTISYEESTKRYADGKAAMQAGSRLGFGKAMYTRIFYKDGSGNYGARKGLANDILGLLKEDIDEFTKNAIYRVENNINWSTRNNK